jgi:multiple sugar transport system substrate-binding protein
VRETEDEDDRMADQPIPLYYQLKRRLLEQILEGRYGADGRLPTEHELCEQYGFSRTPVTRALSELAEEGVVLRHRRRGTFVNPHWLRRQPGAPEVRVLVPEGPWVEHLGRTAGRDLHLSFVTVDLTELHSVFMHAVAEGRGPDLAVLDSVWVPEFAADGFLTTLEELDDGWIAKEHDGDFLPPFVDAYRYGNGTVAVQAETDLAGLWYRRDALARLGVEPPTSWKELRALGRRLMAEHATRGHAVALPGGSRAAETTTYCLVTLLASNGATVLSADGVTLDSPATVEAMRFLRGLVDDGILPVDAVSYSSDRPIRLLAHGQAAMCFAGSYEAHVLAQATGISLDEVPREFGFAPMPAGPRGRAAVLAGGMVYCIPRQAHHPVLAMRLLRGAVAPDALARLCLGTGQLPPRRTAVGIVAPDSPFHAHTAALLHQAVVRPATPSYALVSAQLQAMLEAVLTRQRGPAAAVARAADMIGAITGLPVLRGARTAGVS